mgnify:FL=1
MEQQNENIDFNKLLDELTERVFYLKLENDIFSEALYMKMEESETIKVQIEDTLYQVLREEGNLEISIDKYGIH